ncbi:hypothetical protein TWF694_011231 [Orbilia ellipsospora]|uniref:Uncharacterized protein n=1 Tax=Orbilia ellipsospora TaxID=2528407 RepID=A0AAV9X8G3_9PEZI
MPIFPRPKARGEQASKKWLSGISGISVGSWNIGLNFEEEEEEELVNTSNATMIDRSEPPISWKAQQVLLARARLEADDEKTESMHSSMAVSTATPKDMVLLESDGPQDCESTAMVNKVAHEKRGMYDVSESNTTVILPMVKSGEQASGAESNSNNGSWVVNSNAVTTYPADKNPTLENKLRAVSSSEVRTGRCAASEEEGCEGGSQGRPRTRIAAKLDQGGRDGGSLQSAIGMPLNTPTQVPSRRDRHQESQAGEEREKQKKQMETVSFLNTVRKQDGGRDIGIHATGFSYSSVLTDNGPWFEEPEEEEDDDGEGPLLSSAGTDDCMNINTLTERAILSANEDENKSARLSPSRFLDSERSLLPSDVSIVSSSEASSSFAEDISPTPLNPRKPRDNNTIDDNRKLLLLSASGSRTSSYTLIPKDTIGRSQDLKLFPSADIIIKKRAAGRDEITRLHYSSYQNRSGLDFDLTRNTTASPPRQPTNSSPSTPASLRQPLLQHHQNNIRQNILDSSNPYPVAIPPPPIPPRRIRNNTPFALTVLTTHSATPSVTLPSSPVNHGPNNSADAVLVPLLSTSDAASPSPSQASSPIAERCASFLAATSLQPQIPVPIPKEYRPQTPPTVGLVESSSSVAESTINELLRPGTASSISTLSAGSSVSFGTSHLSSSTPITHSENNSASNCVLSLSTSPIEMAARSAAAQKSLMRSGAPREQYAPYHYSTKYTNYHPNAHLDNASASSNSSEEFQAQHDIQSLQAMARQREQAEQSGSRGRSDSQSRMQGNYNKTHNKNGSGGGNELLENVFGIYPEKKSMGTGVSVADVVANKLFKWGSKKETPSTIPTPSREQKVQVQRSARHPHHAGYVGGVPQQVASPQRPGSGPYDQDYHPSQRDEMLHSRASNLDHAKLDELMARQKMLEDTINQLRLQRDHLMDINQQPQPLPLKPHHEAAIPPRPPHTYMNLPPAPLRIPSGASIPRPQDMSPAHSISPSVPARQMAEPMSMQFPLPPSQALPQIPQSPQVPQTPSTGSPSPGRPRSSRAFPSSKHMQPLKTTPMAIPLTTRPDPAASSVHYVSRPLPQTPVDATPPPEYEPPELAYGVNRGQYRDNKIKLTSPTSGPVFTHDVIIEEHPDDEQQHEGMPSPRDDVDTDDILGWFDTLKFASTGPRGRGPITPLPRPEAGDIKAPISSADVKNLGYRQPEHAEYIDIKLPIHTTSPDQIYNMGYKKDWNAGRKKRSDVRLRDQAREAETMRVPAV